MSAYTLASSFLVISLAAFSCAPTLRKQLNCSDRDPKDDQARQTVPITEGASVDFLDADARVSMLEGGTVYVRFGGDNENEDQIMELNKPVDYVAYPPGLEGAFTLKRTEKGDLVVEQEMHCPGSKEQR